MPIRNSNSVNPFDERRGFVSRTFPEPQLERGPVLVVLGFRDLSPRPHRDGDAPDRINHDSITSMPISFNSVQTAISQSKRPQI